LLFLLLVIIPIAIWICTKVARENDVSYQSLDTQQILGKISKR
jgi:hypothetical protein